MKHNRSALTSEALKQHLRALEIRELKQRDREGYTKTPQAADDHAAWEAEASWPME